MIASKRNIVAQQRSDGTRAQREDPLREALHTKILGAHGQLPNPGVLSNADWAEADILQEQLGEFMTLCLFSKQWRLRQAALVVLRENLHKLVEDDARAVRQSKEGMKIPRA